MIRSAFTAHVASPSGVSFPSPWAKENRIQEAYSAQSNQSTPSSFNQSPYNHLLSSATNSTSPHQKVGYSVDVFQLNQGDGDADGCFAWSPHDSNSIPIPSPMADSFTQQSIFCHPGVRLEDDFSEGNVGDFRFYEESTGAFQKSDPIAARHLSSVLVRVEDDNFKYQMNGDDLAKVFGRYGDVVGINLYDGGSRAVVHYGSPEGAKNAHESLNEKKLLGIAGSLYVELIHPWYSSSNVAAFPESNPLIPSPILQLCGASQAPSTVTDNSKSPTVDRVRKYTIRYEIQIPPDNDFQVARRIIGLKGMNMKRIFKSTDSKLRLRGRGSGYLEGYAKEEADEPLHLCISSCDIAKYEMACHLVEELLRKIYGEFDQWLFRQGRGLQHLDIKSKETLISNRSGSDLATPTTRRKGFPSTPAESSGRSLRLIGDASPTRGHGYPGARRPLQPKHE